ncbi:MAG TPA: portal protein [Geminicoccaceae bacterium]|nr:portal protein [Geminicoccaceae bacterium]
MIETSLEAVWTRYRRAKERRRRWESLWRDCYTYALPYRGSGLGEQFAPAQRHAERLFDGTAMDGVDQLAAGLLAELTPPWSQWFALVPGTDLDPATSGGVNELLEGVSRTIRAHFDRSNFAMEMHQALLDLATVGTATLLFEEAPVGQASAFRFNAVPMAEMAVEEGPSGRLECYFRRSVMGYEALVARFPAAQLPPTAQEHAGARQEQRFGVIEAVLPSDGGFAYLAFLDEEIDGRGGPTPLAAGCFETSPFVGFRWLKGAGEVYGRSPVMTALPDIKTANKVVELILKNASIAVTGIWQADDDGVINPATIRLVPGAIIPKAVGSAGLTPLQAPGRFDVSQLVIDDLRARIRHALLVDRLGPVNGPRMTATEVLERSAEAGRVLGATYGRLQTELLTPLLGRAMAILRRRGEIPNLVLDGRTVDLRYTSPLARAQARGDVQNTLVWLEAVERMGPEAVGTVDLPATARWLGQALGVPGELIREPQPAAALLDALAPLLGAAGEGGRDD